MTNHGQKFQAFVEFYISFVPFWIESTSVHAQRKHEYYQDDPQDTAEQNPLYTAVLC